MNEHVFESVKALADELEISRTTLYKRAKENDIKLSGTYTQAQFNKLMGVQSKMNTEHGYEQNTEQIEHGNEQPVNSAIQALSEQLTVKDEQIAELNRRLEQAQKLVDQSQQLQLKTQLQLESEQQKVLSLQSEIEQETGESNKNIDEKRGFWKKLFRI